MGQCKWCNRSGWFLSLNSSGLCNNCSPLVNLEASQRIRIINDSLKILSESKNLDTKLSRLNVLLEHANALLKYEQRGIPISDPLPSYFISKFGNMCDQIIADSLKDEVNMASSKAAVAVSTTTKVNMLSKVLLKIREYKARSSNPSLLDQLERQVQTEIQRYQLDGYLDSAKKAEFKGQKKKALDQYYEALYLLRHDEVDDSLQKGQITFIENKISELGGSLE